MAAVPVPVPVPVDVPVLDNIILLVALAVPLAGLGIIILLVVAVPEPVVAPDPDPVLVAFTELPVLELEVPVPFVSPPKRPLNHPLVEPNTPIELDEQHKIRKKPITRSCEFIFCVCDLCEIYEAITVNLPFFFYDVINRSPTSSHGSLIDGSRKTVRPIA